MSNWNPIVSVQINGSNRTSVTVNAVTIDYGRNTVWEQPRAAYASIEILNTTGADYYLEINDEVTVTLEDSDGIPQTIFTGTVVDVVSRVERSGTLGQVCIETVRAFGPMARMSRVIGGTVEYPKEYDDVRLDRILTEAGVLIDVVDSPGVYQFTKRAPSPADTYTLAANYAQQAFGYLYETTDGKVGYANDSRRTLESQAVGYFQIPTNDILWDGLTSQRTLADMTNSIILSYKANAIVTASDATSITNFGLIEGNISTELEESDEAQAQADRYVALRANPQTSLSAFTMPLTSGEMSDATRDTLITTYVGKPIEIQSLPIPIVDVTYRGFVEGWSWQISRTEAFLTIRSTDSTYSITPARWQDLAATLKWSDLDPALQWFEYE